jgi:RTX calcium-binding nonapeptide repeat (4 copies)
MEALVSGQNVYGNIDPGSLDQLFGLLEPFEGFGSAPVTHSQDGSLYVAIEPGKAIPDIAYGMNLKDVNSLTAVLDSLSVSSQALVNGQMQSFSGNVFQIAANIATARGQTVPTASEIVTYFQGLIAIDTSSNLLPIVTASFMAAQLQNDLNNALTDFVTGNTPQYLTELPPPVASNPIDFVLSPTQGELALQEFIDGGVLTETAGNSLSISGKSTAVAAAIRAGFNSNLPAGASPVASGAAIPGLDPSSAQWEAIVAASFLGTLGSSFASVGKAMAVNDPAQVWCMLRYLAGNASADNSGVYKRDYDEGALFGLNGANANSYAQALQDYTVLGEHRNVIISSEQSFGTDPDSATPETAAKLLAAAQQIGLGQAFTAAGPDAVAPPGASPTTLAATFDPEAALITGELYQQYAAVLPPLIVDKLGDVDTSTAPFYVRSTDIFVAPSAMDFSAQYASRSANGTYTLDVSKGDPGQDGAAEAGRNHIVIGMTTGEILVGGAGNDILVAGTGNETLRAGTDTDTLIGGQGNDDLIGSSTGPDLFDIELDQNPNPATAVETIVDATGSGSIYLNGLQIGGLLTSIGPNKWQDASGNIYRFLSQASNPLSAAGGGLAPSEWTGDLQITPASLVGSGNDVLDIAGFNLESAENNPNGFLGIKIASLVSLTFGATAGNATPDPSLQAGGSQSYTVSVGVPSDVAQAITLSLSGASASDFSFESGGGGPVALNSDGTFTVTIPAGETSASFALLNTGDVGGNAALQLTASISDPNDPSDPTISSSPLNFNLVQPTDDPFSTPPSSSLYGGSTIAGVSYFTDLSMSNGQLDQPVAIGTGPSDIVLYGHDESIVGGTGNDTIDASFGYDPGTDGGTDQIIGNGGQDQIFNLAQGGAVKIFADSAEDIATAIQNAQEVPVTSAPGDMITTGGPGTNTTIVVATAMT